MSECTTAEYCKLRFNIENGSAPGRASVCFTYDNRDIVQGKNIDVITGKKGTWIIKYIAKERLERGSALGIARESWIGFYFGVRPQNFNPKGLDYVTAETTAKARLELLVNSWDPYHSLPVAKISIQNGAIESDEEILIRIGDKRYGGPGSTVFTHAQTGCKIKLGLAQRGNNAFTEISGSPLVINTIPSQVPKRYLLVGPSIVELEETFSLNLVALDANGNLVSECKERITLACPECENLPRRYQFSEKDKGRKIFDGLFFSSTGIHYVKLEDEPNKIKCRSNPIKCVVHAKERIFWGDIHAHAYDALEIKALNPTTHPESNYRYGKEVSALDFCALTSHIIRNHKEAAREWWPIAREACEKHNESGIYVTFLGCEWRDRESEGGDRNIIFKRPPEEVVDPNLKIEDLYKIYRGKEAIIIPHVGGVIANWDYHDPELEVLCEIASGHGNFEWFAQEALARGYKVGVIGSSDGHNGIPGHPRVVALTGGSFLTKKGERGILNRRDSGYGGGPLVAVQSYELTREAVWQAFKEKKVYATTGARVILDFRIDGIGIGSELEVANPPRISVNVAGTAPIQRVDIIRNNRLIFSKQGLSQTLTLGFSFLDNLIKLGQNYYYLRVIQEDGEIAWSSPIWVRSRVGKKKEEKTLPAWNKDEEVSLQELSHASAARYLSNLLDYLEREESLGIFADLTPVRIVDSTMGKYALFYGIHVKSGKRISVKWYFEFEIPRLRFEVGWMDYGKERIHNILN